VQVALSKHADSMPLERQCEQMKRAGLKVTTQTLWNQLWGLTKLLEPAKARLHAHLLSKDVVLADETRWPLLGAKGRKTKNHYIWSLVADDGVIFEIEPTRSNAAGARLLAGFRGVAVTDGYVVYESLAKSGAFVLAHDWCHVRRKFIEAESTAPEVASSFLDDIGELFLIERELADRTAGLSLDDATSLRAQVRDERSKVVVSRIGRRATEVKALRESPIAKAIKDLENRWNGLQVYLRDGRVPITSNGVERALRIPVLGRKNSLGSRSERGIKSASVLYSLIESAKLCGVEPGAYLKAAARAAIHGETIPLPHELA